MAVNTSQDKGTKKRNVRRCELLSGFGLKGDAHGGHWHRQVSLLANESIDKMRRKGLKAAFGDFAENITTEGIDLKNLPIGTTLRIGPEVILRMTQKGKECHDRCAIYYQAGHSPLAPLGKAALGRESDGTLRPLPPLLCP